MSCEEEFDRPSGHRIPPQQLRAVPHHDSADTVLIVTQEIDATADIVINELHRRDVRVLRADIAEFPQNLSMETQLTSGGEWNGTLSTPRWRAELREITGAYYRRPTSVQVSNDLTPTDQRWAAREALQGFGGSLAALPHWLNHPAAIGFAEYKPVQLSVAQRCGFNTPPTLLTNTHAAAVQFLNDHAPVVYKAFSSSIDTPDGKQFIYTTRLTHADALDESIATTAHLLQKEVPKVYDVRLTVVDDDMFACRIDATTEETTLDWRREYSSLTHTLITTPDVVARSVRRMLKQLHLRFAAIDFSVDNAGQWWFLDLNPNGQWSWIEHTTQAPIAQSIANALMHPPPRQGTIGEWLP